MAGNRLSTIRVGDLKDYVIIQSKSVSKDSVGGDVETWATFLSVWMRLVPYKGAEAMWAAQPRMVISHYAYVQYDATILPTMRVLFGSRLFAIVSVDDMDEEHIFTRLSLLEGVPTT